MLSDAEFFHRLDVALAPVSKVFQHPVPFHGRLRELGGSLSEGQMTLTSSLRRAPSISGTAGGGGGGSGELSEGSRDKEAQAVEATLRQIAKAECESRVEGLQQWLERAQNGRRIGEQCLSVLNSLSSCLGSMRDVTGAVQEQSNHLSSNASALMVRKTKLEMVQEELQRMIKHFTRIGVLTREAEQPTLSATSARYPGMLQEMEEEMQFLSRNPQFLSSKVYATKLAVAQQRAFQCLKDAVVVSLQAAQTATTDADLYQCAFYQKQQSSENAAPGSAADTELITTPLSFHGAEESTERQRMVSEKLSAINSIFCEKLSEKASLRRMMEARRGEGQMEDDMSDNDILDAYREARVVIVGPLLQNWLEEWCGSGTTSKSMPQLVIHLIELMKIALAHEKEVFDEVWLREDFSARVFPQLVVGVSNEVYHVFRSRLLQLDELGELAQTIEEIQRANVRQEDGVAELGGLLTKMTQDTQERLIFRTSVFLREAIVRCSPTKAMAQQFLCKDNTTEDTDIPALNNCVSLLRLLYPSLELSVFSVFAEEAIHCTLLQVQELAKIMGHQQGEYSVLKGLMCQLSHLLHLREELSRIDENITVVEKRIDLTRIAQRRLEIVQSSRESKKDVESEIKSCCDRIVQAFFAEVSSPLSGIARKKPKEIETAAGTVEKKWSTLETLLSVYIANAATREVLLRPVRARLDELLRETASIQRQHGRGSPEGVGSLAPTASAEGSSTPPLRDGRKKVEESTQSH
ncbi:hypothetical protein DQ04_01961030 [Trypanosoma grayi]|uniref:hypothetical protein n=1 Tax=Trypanosoma grayi TaxID=71804 RepID=UPI0004F43A96|nr:hypothetical protein DQ04_01961030 [Trypanosoma grayi]KEG12142.1 hypothetical protein DQ04_01961030 [Trypanosoma grayi]